MSPFIKYFFTYHVSSIIILLEVGKFPFFVVSIVFFLVFQFSRLILALYADIPALYAKIPCYLVLCVYYFARCASGGGSHGWRGGVPVLVRVFNQAGI